MDDTSTHGDDDSQDKDLDLEDTDADEGDDTPADTEDNSDDPKADDAAQEAKERQKKAWLSNLRDGKKTIDDMPKNLEWLKKDKEFDEFRDSKKEKKPEKKLEVEDDELDSRVRKTLKSEREAENLEFLIEGLEDMEIDSETDALLQEEYEALRADGLSKYKALTMACRLAGIKDIQTIVAERRRKGMTLPPRGSKRRKTIVKKGGNTEMETKFMKNLPPGYKS